MQEKKLTFSDRGILHQLKFLCEIQIDKVFENYSLMNKSQTAID